jgi:hypothetical protein
MDAKTLLGIGAIGGAVYLATSKKAQAKVKKTTGLSNKPKRKVGLSDRDVIKYKITEIEDNITKAELRVLKKFLGEFTLKTNAGVDIHSSEIKNDRWNGIKIERL